jgi:multifunctional beta-oxidation protein
LAFTNECTVAVVKLQADGFKGVGKITVMPKIPNRSPDMVFSAKSYPNQAIVYRLSGDLNPLHIDPKFAAIQKF